MSRRLPPPLSCSWNFERIWTCRRMHERRVIMTLEEGFAPILEKAIKPLIRLIESKEARFFSSQEFVGFYNHIFSLATQPQEYNLSEGLYMKFSESLQDYLKNVVAKSLEQSKASHDRALLADWQLRFSNHKHITFGLCKLFQYLDRFYVQNGEDILPLEQQAYTLYQCHIFSEFSIPARNAILRLIMAEREKIEQVDHAILKASVDVFVDLGFKIKTEDKMEFYHHALELDLVDHAAVYYGKCADTWLREDSSAEYLRKCEKALEAERKRVQAYLQDQTMKPLTRRIYNATLGKHQIAMLEKKSGLAYLLEEKDYDSLRRMYKLYRSYPKDLQPIADIFQREITRDGRETLKNHENKKQDKNNLILQLLKLHKKYHNFTVTCFERHQVFQKAVRNAFESFLNQTDNVSKLLATYVHSVLHKGTRETNPKEQLEQAVFLYSFIRDKDIFDHAYQVLLQERLLKNKSESEESERYMIRLLQSASGYRMFNKFNQMYKDVNISKGLTAQFKKSFDPETKHGLTLNLNVCTNGFWPSSSYVDGKIPLELRQITDGFREFYRKKHDQRELHWRLDMGQAEVAVNFNQQTQIRFAVSTYQMAILLVFNRKTTVTYQDVLDVTGLRDTTDLQNHLLSLAHPKVKILAKKPPGRPGKFLARNVMFRINTGFKSRLKKMTVPIFVLIKNGVVNKIDPAVDIERKALLDLHIVRTLKAKKFILHTHLVKEVTQMLSARFKATPGMIKKRIEYLMDDGMLERHQGGYHYIS